MAADGMAIYTIRKDLKGKIKRVCVDELDLAGREDGGVMNASGFWSLDLAYGWWCHSRS